MENKLETLQSAVAASAGSEFVMIRTADFQWLLDGMPEQPLVQPPAEEATPDADV